MGLFNDLINLLYLLIEIIKIYWLYIFILILIIIFFKVKTDYRKSNEFLKSKTWFIVIDWKFETGKTRFLAQLAQDSKEKGIFVLSNFYNWYNFIKWNSLEDLKNLLYDVWLLGEYQNFTDQDLKNIYYQDSKETYKQKLIERKNIRKKYKNIPYNWYHNRFAILWDEFQNYFFNRWAMWNFSWENKNLLKLFHQVRHFNSLCVLATQESDELDVKFRRLSTYYINTWEKMDWMLYYYNVYQFLTDKENNLNLEKAYKFTKMPVYKINYYALNNIIKSIEYKLNSLNKYHDKINSFLKFELFADRIIKYRFANELIFHTKYNVDPDVNTYKSWDLFVALNNFYKNKTKYHLTNVN